MADADADAAATDEQQNPETDGNITEEKSTGEGTSLTCKYRFESGPKKESTNHLLDKKASKPAETKEKKYTKEDRMRDYNNRMKRYMRFALQKYNSEQKKDKDMQFMFDKTRHQNWIVEGECNNKWYHHFNFTAKQAYSTACLFFVEVVLNDGDEFDITCCKILQEDDNGHCFGCKMTCVDLKHPSCESQYVGGHEERRHFAFMEGSDSEDDD